MLDARESHGIIGRAADVKSVKDYMGHKIFATSDGSSGFTISPDGEITTLISKAGSTPSFSDSAMALAAENGGTWLNAYDTVLPPKYSRAGFKPVARLPFDEEIAKADMGEETYRAFVRRFSDFNDGKPDLVFMVYDPKYKTKVANGVGGKIVKDWDAAMREVERAKMRGGNQ